MADAHEDGEARDGFAGFPVLIEVAGAGSGYPRKSG